MKPLRDRSPEARANPKGIPYLYVATCELTAVAEVRPSLGALVTIAQLKTARALRLINCTTGDQGTKVYFEEPDAPERTSAVWSDIDRAFSTPIDHADDVASYAPTQIIAEVFRERGIDGLAYRSSLGPPHNIVLFDLDAAEACNCSLGEIHGLTLDYRRQSGTTVVVEKRSRKRHAV